MLLGHGKCEKSRPPGSSTINVNKVNMRKLRRINAKNEKYSQVPDKLKLNLIPTEDCVSRPLDLPLDLPREEDLDPRPREDDLLYSNELFLLLMFLLVLGLPFLGGLA